MTETGQKSGSDTRENVLEELDKLLDYIDEDSSLPNFFEEQNTVLGTEQENTVPTLTTVAEENEVSSSSGVIDESQQPGLFSERLEKIKQKIYDSEHPVQPEAREDLEQTQEFKIPSQNDRVEPSEAANEDRVPTLSDQAELQGTELEQLVDRLVQEQMPLLESKLRAKLKQALHEKNAKR